MLPKIVLLLKTCISTSLCSTNVNCNYVKYPVNEGLYHKKKVNLMIVFTVHTRTCKKIKEKEVECEKPFR